MDITMEFIQVTRWIEMQQYKDRDPKWIKVYRELLDDYEFSKLDDVSKYHVIGIRLLAAKLDNKIPNDPEWIQKKLSSTHEVSIETLIDAGFIAEYDGTENCVRIRTVPYLETEGEKRQSREETEADKIDSFAFRSYWNSKEKLKAIRSVTSKRREHLKARLKEPLFCSDWKIAIDKIAASDFCCGANDRKWAASFDWLIANDTNYVKVMEGKYDNKADVVDPQKAKTKALFKKAFENE